MKTGPDNLDISAATYAGRARAHPDQVTRRPKYGRSTSVSLGFGSACGFGNHDVFRLLDFSIGNANRPCLASRPLSRSRSRRIGQRDFVAERSSYIPQLPRPSAGIWFELRILHSKAQHVSDRRPDERSRSQTRAPFRGGSLRSTRCGAVGLEKDTRGAPKSLA